MTFSRASLSLADVEDVEATAAGTEGLRAATGGSAACWRVAGAIAAFGTVDAAGATETVGFGVVLADALSAAFSVVFSVVFSAVFSVLGTTLRAIGRGFGSGTLCLVSACFSVALASASFAIACEPMTSASIVARVVAMAVERKAAARTERVTAFLCGESRKTSVTRSSSLNMRKKHLIRRAGSATGRCLRHHHGKIAAGC